MADEAIAAFHELQTWPKGLHWFCAKVNDDDQQRCYDEDFADTDLEKETEAEKKRRLAKVEEARMRTKTVLAALLIFAFDGDQAVQMQKAILETLDNLMRVCDVCIRTYHAARAELKEGLEGDYEPQQVTEFMDKFDGINVERIKAGLQRAERQLLHLPVEKRRVTHMDAEGLYALFEAMNCEPYLRNNQLLTDTFVEPFQLLQANRKLRLPVYLPAFAYFVFSTHEYLFSWGVYAWGRITRPPTALEFETVVRKPLQLALGRVQMNGIEASYLPTFWHGLAIVMSKLDSALIDNSLRPMNVGLHRLTLDQFSLKEIDITTFAHQVSVWHALLAKSPEFFWDAMRTIPAKAIVEQFFRSSSLAQVLMRTEAPGMPSLDHVLSWIRPFMATIKTNRVSACAALLRELVERSKNDKYSRAAKAYCFTLALHVLQQALEGIIEPQTFEAYVGSAVAADMLEQVTEHLSLIMEYTRGVKNGDKTEVDTTTALSIIENAVALDSLVLEMDYRAVKAQKSRTSTAPKNTDLFWTRLTRGMGMSDQALATRVLLGLRRFVGLERFGPKFAARALDDPKHFAETFDTRCIQVSDFLEKLADFPPYQLAGFFKTAETADSIVHALFSSDVGVRQGGVELLKSMSQKTDRLDAISHVLDAAYFTFLTAFTKSMNEISSKLIFTPMSGMVKLCTDIVEALCNPSSGILRTRNLVEQEVEVTKAFWRVMWSVCKRVFENMEQWGSQGYDKQLLMDFCRDTMQFADTLFDQYSVFLNAIKDDYADEESTREQSKKLLQHPRTSMDSMVKWLRLRDDYLVTKIVSLVTSLLARLNKSKVKAMDTTLEYIDQIGLGKVRNNLSKSQTAQLMDALDKYTDRPATRPPEAKKSAKQTSLTTWTTSGRSKDDAVDLDADPKAARAKVIADATKGAEQFKKLKEQKKLGAAAKKPVPDPKKNLLDQAEFLRRRKAQMEEDERKKAALVAARRGNLPGPGAAINSVGVATKDHSMKGQGVMVDSDEESEESSDDDSEDDLDRELFGKTAKKSHKPANAMSEEASAKLLAARGPVKVRKIQRSARDMRARLAPDLSKLHQEILAWDYFHEGHYPPNSRTDLFQRVPERIEDADSYKNIFQPLLILEMWSKINNDRNQDSQTRPYEIKVISRASVDAFVEVSTSMPSPADQKLDVHEGDLVLLSTAQNPRNAPDKPSCLGRIYKVTRKKQHFEVMFRVIPGNNNKMMGSFNGQTVINALKIESLVTVEREYGALMGLQYYDLCDYVLQAEPSRLLKYAETQLKPLMDNYDLNQAQAKAVKSALDNDAFTLIQGPPGSGKTKTIVATVGALLTGTLSKSTAVRRPGAPNGAPPVAAASSKKLLVCAPSNAAVDELVLRFKAGIKMLDGTEKKINVVRLGRSEKINSQVVEVTLEELIARRLDKAAGSTEKQRVETHKLMQEHKELSANLNAAQQRIQSDEGKGPEASKIQDEIDALRKRRRDLSLLIDQAKDNEQNTVRQNDLERKRVEQAILDEAHILCATLSASGHDRFQNLSLEFETVIVDEAAQCTELQALIPLKYGAAKCILVGDPKQLPPTTFMDAKLNFQYEQSLFVRMQNNKPNDVHLLDTQYRMHPEISSFPSKCFYDSRLLDGAGMAKLREKPWHKDPVLGPYRFFDVQGQQTSRGSSLTNKMEIRAAMQLYDKLISSCPSYDFDGKIGIITPYKAQYNAMRWEFQEQYGHSIVDRIEFNTTDAFQGRECEIIIFSCVRASQGSIGFLNDYRRMNVGLTRAKSSLWVLGNTNSLVNGRDWRAMIEDAQRRDRISPSADITKGRPSGHYQPIPNGASKLNYDDGVHMGGGSGATSSANSRQSSVSSFSKPVPTGPANDRKTHIKSEYANEHSYVKKEYHAEHKQGYDRMEMDVEMKDEFSDGTASSIKTENVRVKHEIKEENGKVVKEHRISAPPPPTGPAAANAAPGYLMPRPPGQMPIKRKKAPANPLLESKRPKKH